MKQAFQAILWDCDGVLIDSEVISCGANVEFMRGCGYDISLEKFLTRYMGKGRAQILAEVRTESGVDLTPHYATGVFDEIQNARFRAEIKASPGVADILGRVQAPMAVASGSEPDRLALTLGVAGLSGYFEGRVFSSTMVAQGKPAPDIFLHAARQLGVAPEKCLVIEDGVHGIHAAKAAGMEVWAYLGGSHIFPDLRAQILAAGPSRAFENMAEIYAALFGEYAMMAKAG